MSNLENTLREQLDSLVGSVFDSKLPEEIVSEVVENERFLACRDFCVKTEMVPYLRKTIWNGYEIGCFLRDRIMCRINPKDRAWIELIRLVSPTIRCMFDDRLHRYKPVLMNSCYRFHTLHTFCTITNRLPDKRDIYFTVPIRAYLDGLISGKLRYFSKRQRYELTILKQISPKIQEEINNLCLESNDCLSTEDYYELKNSKN